MPILSVLMTVWIAWVTAMEASHGDADSVPVDAIMEFREMHKDTGMQHVPTKDIPCNVDVVEKVFNSSGKVFSSVSENNLIHSKLSFIYWICFFFLR